MYYNQEWSPASSKTSTFLDQKAKEQDTVFFYKFAIFQCTYNQDGVFGHYQLALCYDVPQKNILTYFKASKYYTLPPATKYYTFIFNPDLPKYHYIKKNQRGFNWSSS